jgi:putative flippase GtrA
MIKILDEFWRVVRFSIVGIVATAAHVSVAIIAVSVAGVFPVVGSVIGFLAAFMISYYGHSRFTFAVAGQSRDELLRFGIAGLVSFILSTIVVWVLTSILRVDSKSALVATGIIVPISNYLINRFWVFLHHAGGHLASR